MGESIPYFSLFPCHLPGNLSLDGAFPPVKHKLSRRKTFSTIFIPCHGIYTYFWSMASFTGSAIILWHICIFFVRNLNILSLFSWQIWLRFVYFFIFVEMLSFCFFNSVQFNDSWFVLHDSSWSFHKPNFRRKHVFYESYRVDRTQNYGF